MFIETSSKAGFNIKVISTQQVLCFFFLDVHLVLFELMGFLYKFLDGQ